MATPADKEAHKMTPYEYHRTLPPEQYAEELKKILYERTGEVLDLKEPKTYNAKLQWLKLYDNVPEKTCLADKYQVREFVKDRIGKEYLIPLLGVWDSFDEIDFDSLPDSFVLKTTHSWNTNVIVPEKALLDIDAARYNFNFWMQDNLACQSLELHYADIQPKIIAEEFLSNDGDDLRDYKVLCFNGKAECILYIQNRNSGKQLAFFDLDWNKLDITHNGIPIVKDDVPRPADLKKLIQLAETLAAGFALVRVDFYILNSGEIRFGEMTFTPAQGMSRWEPEEINRIWGEKIILPENRTPLPEASFADRGVKERPPFSRKETDYRKALQKQEKRNSTLEKENKKLKKQVAELQKKMSAIQSEARKKVTFKAVLKRYLSSVRRRLVRFLRRKN